MKVDTSQAIQPKILVESDAKMKILNSDQESFYRSAKPSGHYIQNTTEDRENTKSKMEFADIKVDSTFYILYVLHLNPSHLGKRKHEHGR